MFNYVPKSMSVYVNRCFLNFGQSKFGEQVQRSFTICNESPHSLWVGSSFYTKESEFDATLEGSPQSGISQKIIESAVSMHSVLIFDFDDDDKSETLNFNESANIQFNVQLPHQLRPMSTNEIAISFRPVDSNEISDNEIPPYEELTKINLCFSDSMECIESHSIILSGEIKGIEVEIFPKVIDFRKIYLGEEHCAFIKVLNVDGR